MAETDFPNRRIRVWITTSLALVLAVALLVLAIPRGIAVSQQVVADTLLRKLGKGETLGPEAFRRIADAKYRAVRWHMSGRSYADLSFAEFAIALGGRTSGRVLDMAAVDRAIGAAKKSVSLEPMNTGSWLRLGHLQYQRDGMGIQAARSAAMSFTTGPHERDLRYKRIRLMLPAWQFLAPEARLHLLSDIRYGFEHSPRYLARTIANNRQLALVQIALSTKKGYRQRFEQYLPVIIRDEKLPITLLPKS